MPARAAIPRHRFPLHAPHRASHPSRAAAADRPIWRTSRAEVVLTLLIVVLCMCGALAVGAAYSWQL